MGFEIGRKQKKIQMIKIVVDRIIITYYFCSSRILFVQVTKTGLRRRISNRYRDRVKFEMNYAIVCNVFIKEKKCILYSRRPKC